MNTTRTLRWVWVLGLLGACGAPDKTVGDKPEIKTDVSQSIDAVEPSGGGWRLVRTVDSAHPYANNEQRRWQVDATAASVNEMKVSFARFELENGYDYLTLSDANGAQVTRHTGEKTGQEFAVQGGSVVLALETDYSVTKWGFSAKIYEREACICPEYYSPVCGVDGTTYGNLCMAGCAGAGIAYQGQCGAQSWMTVSRSIETPHPYSNNYMRKWTITEGGASYIRVHFVQVEVERGYDFVKVYDGNGRQVAMYSGSKSDFYTPTIEGDTATVELVSDYSVTGYGFSIDAYDVTGGCMTDADCPQNNRCDHIQCIRAPCFNVCTPIGGGTTYTDVALADLERNPSRYQGQLIRVQAEPNADLAACTRRACSQDNPCCNVCSSSFRIGTTRIMLADTTENPIECRGNECNWQQSCEEFVTYQPGLYDLEGRFMYDAQGNHKLLVASYSAANCQRGGCSGQVCANAPAVSTCEWRPEYACYRTATCEAQGSGHCGWTMTTTLQQCLAGSGSTRFEATDTPLEIPDNDSAGVTSVLDVTGGAATSVKVSLHLTHTYRGDLVVTLTSPDGRSATLHDRQGGSADNVILENFEVAAFHGTALTGRWTLKVQDLARQDVGTLDSWALEVQ